MSCLLCFPVYSVNVSRLADFDPRIMLCLISAWDATRVSVEVHPASWASTEHLQRVHSFVATDVMRMRAMIALTNTVWSIFRHALAWRTASINMSAHICLEKAEAERGRVAMESSDTNLRNANLHATEVLSQLNAAALARRVACPAMVFQRRVGGGITIRINVS